jgi:RNA 3'-terminal phosphate cyclase (ATP)
MIDIDGSAGEGGGQILRTSLALAMCTGQPVTIDRIRAKRPKPGLMRQHLVCVQAAAAVSGARVQGAELGSRTLMFAPGRVRSGEYSFDIGSAGSCTLVLQTVLPALMTAEAPSRITLRGGTHNGMAPPYHFIARAFAPLVRRLGVGVSLELRAHGFYPAGGGEMHAAIYPPGDGLMLVDIVERGAARAHYAECLLANLAANIAARELNAFGSNSGWTADQLRTVAVRDSNGPGNALMATLEHESLTEVFTSFGDVGVSSERVAGRLWKDVRAYLGREAALGPYLADQWMVPLALAVTARGTEAAYTASEITEHSSTNVSVIERFLPVRFALEKGDRRWTVRVQPTR